MISWRTKKLEVYKCEGLGLEHDIFFSPLRWFLECLNSYHSISLVWHLTLCMYHLNMCFVVWINILNIQWESIERNVRFNLVQFNQTSRWWKDFCKSFPMHNSSLTHNILIILMSSLATSAFAIENKAFNIHLLFKFPIHLEILISISFYTFSMSWMGIILSLRLVGLC